MTLTSGLTGAEIAKHNDAKSCWVIVHGKAYDVTEFLPEHPGGQKIILKYAGKDATEEYEPIHPPDTLDKYLDKSKHLGPVDMASVVVETKEEDPDEVARQERFNQRPLLEQCYNLMDFEAVARRVMKKTAWGYYSSAADDEITLRENHAAFHRIWFRPRILVDVEHVDFSTTMLGTKVDMPFYVTATALGKLGHPEGEVLLTRAAAKHNVIQMIPTLASCAFDEMLDAAAADQVQWLQLSAAARRTCAASSPTPAATFSPARPPTRARAPRAPSRPLSTLPCRGRTSPGSRASPRCPSSSRVSSASRTCCAPSRPASRASCCRTTAAASSTLRAAPLRSSPRPWPCCASKGSRTGLRSSSTAASVAPPTSSRPCASAPRASASAAPSSTPWPATALRASTAPCSCCATRWR
ncbi:cytochrome b2 [Verticillium alfalfae VaMs.102]|uniref:Cytochrome b2 n=1 Tax=Verticillium alfalfae (strain VaMs.102 / ATCC MYA-4576 / FGSC 10136) TaxID=526221 RepID=C9SK23_VERA1|nr:cytochrome b2 [Verticillium alfalfae VaMs.102]EEY19041.1 cytochrome b2 [Verticillium alfalfae VaMs.102]